MRTAIGVLAALVFLSGLAAGTGALAQRGDTAEARQREAAAEKPEAVVPLAEVPRHAEEELDFLDATREEILADRTVPRLEQELAVLSREIDARLVEHRKTVTRTASIDMLRHAERRWAPLRANLEAADRELARRIGFIDRRLAAVDEHRRLWQASLAAATAEAPPEVRQRMAEVLRQLERTREFLVERRSQLLALQNRVSTQDARVAEALAGIRRAREALEEHIFERDSVPVWQIDAAPLGGTGSVLAASVATQWSAVQAYAERHQSAMALHAAAFAGLAGLLYGTRRRVRRWLGEHQELADAATVLQAPLAAALLAALVAAVILYRDAPALLFPLLGAAGLVPAIVILRRLIEPSLRAVLYGLAAFYAVDQMRIVMAPVALLPRLVFLAEMGAAALFAAWLALSHERGAAADAAARRLPEFDPLGVRHAVTLRRASCIALAVATVSFAANALGYVTLASVLGNTLLGSTYVALTIYAMVQILEDVFALALHLRPLELLGAVRRHRSLLQRRARRLLAWIAAGLWILYVLDRLALRERLFRAASDILFAEAALGTFTISLADVLGAIIAVWAAFAVSRFVRFLLDEDVYTRVTLGQGVPYAISSVLNYTILVAGFFVGMAALGFDMTKLTILAGAFSVGVGFGLQDIFKNFVSGLILLVERPVKVGDVIDVDNSSGVIEHIGIRASTLRTPDGSEIIMPNSKLISDRVVNWTFRSRDRSILLPLSLPIGTDLRRALRVLEEDAARHPQVSKEPPPKAIVVRLGPDWIGVELRAHTMDAEKWMEVRSDLALSSAQALAAASISVR